MDIDPLILSRKRNLESSGLSSSVKKPYRSTRILTSMENAPIDNASNVSAVEKRASVSFPPTTPGEDNMLKTSVRHRMYNNKDLPPYVVHVHSVSTNGDHDSGSVPAPLHPTVVGSILVSIIGNDILETKKNGKGKISVELRSYTAANNLVTNNSLAKHNLKAFIPLHRVLRTGIIKDVPQEIDVEKIQESLCSPCKVVEVKEAHPEGENCHLQALARQSPRCINCMGNHLATSHECPVIQEHKAVLRLAATENISLVEAKTKIRYSNENSRSLPMSDPRVDFQNFPLLDVRSGDNVYDSKQRVGNAHNISASPSYADKIRHKIMMETFRGVFLPPPDPRFVEVLVKILITV
ncbi:hypothetical protein ALC62_13526 [Cyphomyrmex costatus]|uniref:Uncharacterized protein n=1 Tax=Cyphomyrmex costatus TaxID=456900 RepID=A0A151I9Y1_9HYME|nr:hypothetical protein ALC62_13526 [Cyphomyrmex costatus]